MWVSFAEHSIFYSALLQKRPMFLRSLLIVATSYVIKAQTHLNDYIWKTAFGCGRLLLNVLHVDVDVTCNMCCIWIY